MGQDSKLAIRKGLIDTMKINFEQHISQSELQILPSLDQLEAALSEQYFLSNSLSSDQQLKKLRTCVKAKASQGNYPVAIALLDRLIALCPDNAVDYNNRGIALCPDNAVDYNNRGLMHFCNNQIVEALCDLSQALKINPHLDSAYNNRANCYAARGELAEAIADYDTALDLNPANLRAWINQGIAFRELEMYDLAIENFDITLIIGDEAELIIYRETGTAPLPTIKQL